MGKGRNQKFSLGHVEIPIRDPSREINQEVRGKVTTLCHQHIRWFVKPSNWMRPPGGKVWMKKKRCVKPQLSGKPTFRVWETRKKWPVN